MYKKSRGGRNSLKIEALVLRGLLAAVLLGCLSEKGPAQQNTRALHDARPVILESVELPVRDADGIALGDINGDGNIDILASEGGYLTTIWFEQGKTWKEWTKHHIHTIDASDGSGTQIEGNALGDVDGDGCLEAISLNQAEGEIYLHRFQDDSTKEWESAVIRDGRPLVQDIMITDVDEDGQNDLVYTWEGRDHGEGGVHWLTLTGDDPMNPDHWEDHVMAVHESVWWLAPARMDITGDGKATEIVFTARYLQSRNPGSKRGLYWMEPPADVTERWPVHTIDNTIPHPLHVDTGDLSGNGTGNDLVVSGFDTDRIYWYEFGAEWKRHEIKLPQIGSLQPDRIWNIKTMRLGGKREGILAPVVEQEEDRGALLYFEYIDGKFESRILRELDYNHPMDDRILLYDLTGDGQAEVLIPDSGPGVNVLHILRLGRDW